VAWLHLRRFDKARKCADRNVNSATDHDVLELSDVNEMAHLTLGNSNPRGKLLWRF